MSSAYFSEAEESSYTNLCNNKCTKYTSTWFILFYSPKPVEQSINSILFSFKYFLVLIGSNFPAKKWSSLLSKGEIPEFLTKTKRTKCKNTQTYCLMEVIYFLRSICEKKLKHFPKPCREIGKKVYEEVRL